MSKKRSSHIDHIRDDADLSYTVDLLFQDRDAEILLIDQGNEVEIAVADIPVPSSYHLASDGNLSSAKQTQVKEYAVARWILDDSARVLERYDWSKANARSNSGNYYLDGIYFKCTRENVDDAVMNAKRFLTELEESVLQHSRKFSSVATLPSEALSDKK